MDGILDHIVDSVGGPPSFLPRNVTLVTRSKLRMRPAIFPRPRRATALT